MKYLKGILCRITTKEGLKLGLNFACHVQMIYTMGMQAPQRAPSVVAVKPVKAMRHQGPLLLATDQLI